LLNVEFSNTCRFRVFQCHFSTVSRFHSRVFSRHSVDMDEQSTGSCPHLYQTFKMLWQIFRADNVFVAYTFISLHAVEIFHCTIRFINQICKEVPDETFSISFRFHKIVHENTFSLTQPCFIWISRAIAKHARIVLTVFVNVKASL